MLLYGFIFKAKGIMVIIQNATYIHPNKDILFQGLHLAINKHEKIALIGNNGVGKSTLLKAIAAELKLTAGSIYCESTPYYIPQLLDRYDGMSIGQALDIDGKLKALQAILDGQLDESNFEILNDDWGLEDRVQQALNRWNLAGLHLDEPFNHLSGGQKTKVFLAGIDIHEPELILMDEPSNHLDLQSREQLYQFIENCNKTLFIVSHDRALLRLIPEMAEMSKSGISRYGGNYDFFAEQKEIANNALDQDVKSKEKELRKAKEKEREASERQNKLNTRGKKKQEKAGIPKILMGGLKNKAEGSSAKLKGVHQEKISGIQQNLSSLRANLPDIDQMKFGFEESGLPIGKNLVELKNVNLIINGKELWKQNLNFQLQYGDRVAVKGNNGSGKTSLIGLILGEVPSFAGELKKADFSFVYVDQSYSMVRSTNSIYDMAQSFNQSGLLEHEVKIRLNRFLFPKESWDKSCLDLSGGERMRLLLCCLNISSKVPDIILLDEPTNNIDIQNMEILTAAIRSYQGTLIVVSHDQYFLEEIGIKKNITLH